MLLIIGEKSWWMWAPAILFAIFFPLLLGGIGTPVATASATENTHTENEKKRKTKVRTFIPVIIFILILAIALIYPYYCIIRDLISNVLESSYSFSEVILTIILILVCLASLSDYISLKFIVADVSNQNYLLSLLRADIDDFEYVETLLENREKLLDLYLPKADSFLLFLNYYGLTFTGYAFEMGEEEDDLEF